VEKFSRGARRRRSRSSSVTSSDGGSFGSFGSIDDVVKGVEEKEKSLPEVPVVVAAGAAKTISTEGWPTGGHQHHHQPLVSALKKHSSFSSFSTPTTLRVSSSIEEADEEEHEEIETEGEGELSEVDDASTSTPAAIHLNSHCYTLRHLSSVQSHGVQSPDAKSWQTT
jgi:hypothetical protein